MWFTDYMKARIAVPEKNNHMTTSQVTVGTTATLIKGENLDRILIIIYTDGDVYIGESGTVTTSDGFKLAAGSAIVLDNYTGSIYGIASSSTTVYVIEIYDQ